jgi:hypothetical protein
VARLNTVLAVALALTLLVAGVALIVAVQWNAAGVVDRATALADWVDSRRLSSLRLFATVAGGVVAVAGIVGLLVQLRGLRNGSEIRFRAPSGELVVVPAGAAAQLLESDVETVPHVAAARVSVVGHGSSAEVAIVLDLDPHAVISEVTRDVARQVDATLEGKLGVKLHRRPTLAVHYDELVLHDRTAAPMVDEPEDEDIETTARIKMNGNGADQERRQP